MPNVGGEMREERRVVTAMFADLVNSTALAERLGPEDANPTDPHTKLLTKIINQYGAGLTVFGDPKYPNELARL